MNRTNCHREGVRVPNESPSTTRTINCLTLKPRPPPKEKSHTIKLLLFVMNWKFVLFVRQSLHFYKRQ